MKFQQEVNIEKKTQAVKSKVNKTRKITKKSIDNINSQWLIIFMSSNVRNSLMIDWFSYSKECINKTRKSEQSNGSLNELLTDDDSIHFTDVDFVVFDYSWSSFFFSSSFSSIEGILPSKIVRMHQCGCVLWLKLDMYHQLFFLFLYIHNIRRLNCSITQVFSSSLKYVPITSMQLLKWLLLSELLFG